jgi:hypothetical protein
MGKTKILGRKKKLAIYVLNILGSGTGATQNYQIQATKKTHYIFPNTRQQVPVQDRQVPPVPGTSTDTYNAGIAGLRIRINFLRCRNLYQHQWIRTLHFTENTCEIVCIIFKYLKPIKILSSSNEKPI